MGYDTDFNGEFKLNKPADEGLKLILDGLATTRRMARKVDENIYGIEGEFYFNHDGFFGQTKEDNIIDHNKPPRTQPGLWCQWELQDDNVTIRWDGNEKFYCYTEWIKYIIERVLKPRGYTLNGVVYWDGEDRTDFGKIEIIDNTVSVYNGVRQYRKRGNT